jgi:hypothetical protein
MTQGIVLPHRINSSTFLHPERTREWWLLGPISSETTICEYRQSISVIQCTKGQQLAARMSHLALANFLCDPSHNLGLGNTKRAKDTANEKNMVINVYTLCERKSKQSQIILMKQICRFSLLKFKILLLVNNRFYV